MQTNIQKSVLEETDSLAALVRSLGPLPSSLRYYDDFDSKVRTIDDFSNCRSISVYINGEIRYVNLSAHSDNFTILAKHLFLHLIAEDIRVITAYSYAGSLRFVEASLLTSLLIAGPQSIKIIWPQLFVNPLQSASFMAVKWLLCILCQRHLLGWSPIYLKFISSNLPINNADKYSSLRTGDAFIAISEEARIVEYIEDKALTCIRNTQLITSYDLNRTSMLMCAYLYGMRPLQIAMVTMRDIRIWNEEDSDSQSVHITFTMAKQRNASTVYPMTRRVKQEWAPLIVELYSRALESGLTGKDRLFEIASAFKVSVAIRELATKIADTRVTATMLRHSAAQRLVDAGASQEEVTTFLGHSDITTALVYFESSPNQAERVNQALSISPIYQQVVKIAHDKFISGNELAQLKGEQQIAGVPHGIPIAGIGGCLSGQPACPYNPITSCYGCKKFMPVIDIEMHKDVLKSMREVVTDFSTASRDDKESPAFLQLQRTLFYIKQVIGELGGSNNE